MNPTDLLQHLYDQFPAGNQPALDFSRVEKFLRKYLNLEKAAFFIRRADGLRSDGEKFFFIPVKHPIFKHLNKNLKPWFAPSSSKEKWAGFWPVIASGEWLGGYGIGFKTNGKNLTPDEKLIMELLSDRTGLFLLVRNLEDRLEKAGRQASLGFLTSAMTHEIRNPLTAMGTFLQLLPQKKNDISFMESFQKLMLREIQHLTQLTENFLDFSKDDSGNLGKVDFNHVLERVTWLLKPLFSSKRVRLKLASSPGLYLKGEERQLESLVMNLLQNAFQSTPAGGMVEASAGYLAKVNGSGPWLEFKVRDNGPGIPKENISKIFNPYFSTKQEGVGLGLAICRQVIENHGGKWMVKSQAKPSGTVFKVLLPCQASVSKE